MSVNAKLIAGATVVAAMVAYVAYLGASSSYQYYVLVDECVADADVLHGKRVRVSGRVATDSLVISDDRGRAEFVLQGEREKIVVTCTGLLPDNLAEGLDVVVEGTLQDAAGLEGDKVLTRCASKYETEAYASK
jgi:cytochrome c-type biogenesis protein CcmE